MPPSQTRLCTNRWRTEHKHTTQRGLFLLLISSSNGDGDDAATGPRPSHRPSPTWAAARPGTSGTGPRDWPRSTCAPTRRARRARSVDRTGTAGSCTGCSASSHPTVPSAATTISTVNNVKRERRTKRSYLRYHVGRVGDGLRRRHDVGNGCTWRRSVVFVLREVRRYVVAGLVQRHVWEHAVRYVRVLRRVLESNTIQVKYIHLSKETFKSPLINYLNPPVEGLKRKKKLN